MYRCHSALLANGPDWRKRAAAAALLGLLCLPAAQAQMQRNFPPTALRGRIVVIDPPQIELNGHTQQLAPGSRIRNQNNLLEMSGALINQTLIVNYTFDNTGMVREVWVLTDEERAKRPWPTSLKQASEWTFDPIAQTWSRP